MRGCLKATRGCEAPGAAGGHKSSEIACEMPGAARIPWDVLSGNCTLWLRFLIYLLEEGKQGAVKSRSGRRFGAKDRPRCAHHGLQ